MAWLASRAGFVRVVLVAGALAALECHAAAPAPESAPEDARRPWHDLPPIVRVLEDDFTVGLDPRRWVSWGTPRPEVVVERHGRRGVFDNRGDGVCDSGVRSFGLVDGGGGFVFSCVVFLEVTDPTGCWLSHRMALTADPNHLPDPDTGDFERANLVEFGIAYEGDACWAVDRERRRQAKLFVGAQPEAMREFPADAWLGRWITMTIEVSAERRARFLVDGNLVWESGGPIDARVGRLQYLLMHGRSRGSAGKAWVDEVSFRAVGAD